MNFIPEDVIDVFQKSIQDWHKNLAPAANPYEKDSMNFILYSKNHIDTIQWHVEDEIRRADIPDSDIAKFKREIDALNQKRTDLVEVLDDYFLNLYKSIPKKPEATEMTITKDILINNSPLRAGTYSIFTIPDKESWTIIINSELGLWGSYNYNAKLDVMRFTIPSKTLQGAVYEPFTILIEQKNNVADIVLLWDSIRIQIPIQFLEPKLP